MKTTYEQHRSVLSGFALLLCGVLVAACGGPPADNPLLMEARLAYAQAEQNELIAAKAPVALQEAAEELRRAEALWRDGAKKAEVTHHAYMAKQRVAIAEETAKLNEAEDQVKQAEVERKEVQLQARAAEAEKARGEAEAERRAAEEARAQAEAKSREAEQKTQEAEEARRVAEAALARAEELTRQIQDLQAQQTERGLVLTLSDVLFDVDKATLKPGGMRAVDQLVTFLNEYPERNVLIEGFTDNTGSDSYNLDLSGRRAEAVRTALVERGIASTRIRTLGYGEDFPVATNAHAAGRQQNRRVEIIISDQDGLIPDRVK